MSLSPKLRAYGQFMSLSPKIKGLWTINELRVQNLGAYGQFVSLGSKP